MKKALVYVIIGFWAVMAALFVRREVIPGLFATPIEGYAALRAQALGRAQERMGIYSSNGLRLGTTETTYQLKPNGELDISSHVSVQLERTTLAALGRLPTELADLMKFDVWCDVTVGADNRLRRFRLARDKQGKAALAYGTVSGESLQITFTFGGERIERTIRMGKDDVLSSGLSPLAGLRSLREGQTWEIKSLDPLEFKLTTVLARVKRKTRIELRGGQYSVYEVELWQPHAVARAWVTESGEVLQQEAGPFILIREPLPHETALPPGVAPTTGPARN